MTKENYPRSQASKTTTTTKTQPCAKAGFRVVQATTIFFKEAPWFVAPCFKNSSYQILNRFPRPTNETILLSELLLTFLKGLNCFAWTVAKCAAGGNRINRCCQFGKTKGGNNGLKGNAGSRSVCKHRSNVSSAVGNFKQMTHMLWLHVKKITKPKP